MVYDEWKAAGEKTFEKRLQDVTLKKMEHRPEPLSEYITKTLDDMQRAWQ
jgi:trimethylamine--corrinoid protein Co-methyltransferase